MRMNLNEASVNVNFCDRENFSEKPEEIMLLTMSILSASSALHVLPKTGGTFVRGTDALMCPKAHGTTANAVAPRIRWGCDRGLADWCCCFNRHMAEPGGYWKTVQFLSDISSSSTPVIFYDSVSQLPLFVAPVNRSLTAFLKETDEHGWPSFRDDEVVWENVRILPDGETVSVGGTHLGHLIPDDTGRPRYCINLVCVAGLPRPALSEDAFRHALRGL